MRTRSMNQKATYWSKGAQDGFGNTAFGVPTGIYCRWQDTSEMFRDAAGREIASNAVVYVASEVVLGGYLYLGLSAEASPRSLALAYEIRKVDRTRNLRANQELWKVWL